MLLLLLLLLLLSSLLQQITLPCCKFYWNSDISWWSLAYFCWSLDIDQILPWLSYCAWGEMIQEGGVWLVNEGKCVPVPKHSTLITYVILQCIIYFGTRWAWVVSFMLHLVYPQKVFHVLTRLVDSRSLVVIVESTNTG
jgi:hypothetical protein